MCSTAIPYCISCTGANNCTACASGFTLTSGSCVCATGRYMDSQGTCPGKNLILLKSSTSYVACPSSLVNCVACSSATTCTTCTAGYGLIAGRCPCPTGNYLNSEGTCAGNLFLPHPLINNLACSTMSHCTTCTGANACTACSSRFFAISGACVCPANTNYVDSQGNCTGNLYPPHPLINNLACSETMSHCTTCTGANACTACSSGFSVSLGLCVCPANTSYVDSQGNCTSKLCPLLRLINNLA